MNSAPFHYTAPATIEEALALLDSPVSTRILAGGQSLVPALRARHQKADQLVDISHISDPIEIALDRSGCAVGLTVRQEDLCQHSGLPVQQPLLYEILRVIGTPISRSRGTVVGLAAQATPGSEFAALAGLQAVTLRLKTRGGERTVRVNELFAGSDSVRASELAVSIHFAAWPSDDVCAVIKHQRTRGGPAIAGIAVRLSRREEHIVSARAAAFGVGAYSPVVDVTDAFSGPPSHADFNAAGAMVSQTSTATDGLHASAAYRKHALGVLAERAFLVAIGRWTHVAST